MNEDQPPRTNMTSKLKPRMKMALNRKLQTSLAALALVAACGAGACDRAHLTASHGRANREAFTAQVANPNAGNRPAPGSERRVQGLDSQEAAIVSQTYRRNLAPRQEDSNGQRNQLLYYAPRAPQADRADMPPPSVPQPR